MVASILTGWPTSSALDGVYSYSMAGQASALFNAPTGGTKLTLHFPAT
jgi:hypothetical protein